MLFYVMSVQMNTNDNNNDVATLVSADILITFNIL